MLLLYLLWETFLSPSAYVPLYICSGRVTFLSFLFHGRQFELGGLKWFFPYFLLHFSLTFMDSQLLLFPFYPSTQLFYLLNQPIFTFHRFKFSVWLTLIYSFKFKFLQVFVASTFLNSHQFHIYIAGFGRVIWHSHFLSNLLLFRNLLITSTCLWSTCSKYQYC